MNSESSFLKALNKESPITPPIWYMRQAGRYMPEYQNVRKKFKNFLDMCKEPDICCELALQPINAFELDAAILFSDILTIPDSFGLGVKFIEKEGPVFKNPISNSTDIKNLNHFDPESLDYVYKAVNNIKNSLPEEIPLIGFCGSPWTLAAYSIEGRSSKDFEKTLSFLESNQEDVHDLLTKYTDACFLYLRKQVQSGADVIQIFDSWANLLTKEDLIEYSFNYINSLISALKLDPITRNIPVIIFARNPKCNIEELINTSADCISLFWSMNDLNFEVAKNKVAIQGEP
jgi:uroporphyrinogen decarboxylase